MSPINRLNAISLFAAINENLFRLLITFFLIALIGKNYTNTIVSLTGVIFLLPFLLFSNVGGYLADRYRKNRVALITRVIEALLITLSLVSFSQNWVYFTLILLFLMATLSSLFGPSKYGLIPELTEKSDLLKANSLIASVTFVGIIVGIFLASLLVASFQIDYFYSLYFALLFALIGIFWSYRLPKTQHANLEKPFNWFIYQENLIAIKEMHKTPYMVATLFAYAYFLFLGTFLQLGLITYTVQTLQMKDFFSGYLFLITSVGLALGSYLTHLISKNRIHLVMIPLSSIGFSFGFICLAFFYSHLYLICIWLFFTGVFGGTFLVPAQAYLISQSPEKTRGRNFGVANLGSFLCALIAASTLYFLGDVLSLSPPNSYLAVGIFNAALTLLVTLKARHL